MEPAASYTTFMRLTLNIEFLNLKAINQQYQEQIHTAINEVLNSGWYILGKQVDSFEKKYAAFCKTKHAIGVASGLDALMLNLKAWVELGYLSDGDEVLIPANTYIATALAVSNAGLKPKLIDPDASTMNLTVEGLKGAISKKTKAIIAVHLTGRMAPMPEIMDFAAQHGLLVLEDAAQAHGAMIDNTPAGSWGDAAGFSFYPGKNIGAIGDGGIITTNDDELAKTLLMLRNYGCQEKYVHKIKGYNSRLDELQAAILKIKLKDYDEQLRQRRRVAEFYQNHIKNPLVTLPLNDITEEHVWHLYVIRIKQRDALQSYLSEKGIQTLIHYKKALAEQTAYRASFAQQDYPIAKQLSEEILSLPMSPILSTEELQYICNAVNTFR